MDSRRVGLARYAVREVPPAHITVDEASFGDEWSRQVIAASNLHLDVDTVRSFGRWFVRSGAGWKSTWDDVHWTEGRHRLAPGQVADHLAAARSAGDRAYQLHMLCKCTVVDRKAFLWTRYLGIDLDNREGASQQLDERYRACVQLLGSVVVLASPGGGLHLYWPLKAPLSVYGLTAHGKAGLPILLHDALVSAGLDVRPGNIEIRPLPKVTLRLPLSPGMKLLDPDYLTPLPFSSREAEIEYLVASMCLRQGPHVGRSKEAALFRGALCRLSMYVASKRRACTSHVRAMRRSWSSPDNGGSWMGSPPSRPCWT